MIRCSTSQDLFLLSVHYWLEGRVIVAVVVTRAVLSVQKFRRCMKDELKKVVLSPLPAPRAFADHCNAVMDLCISTWSSSGKSSRRKHPLRTLANGNWGSEDIVYFAGSDEAVARFNKVSWAERASGPLLPCAPPVQRCGTTHWVNSVEPLMCYSLVCELPQSFQQSWQSILWDRGSPEGGF